MKLTKENIEEWKKELDELMREYTPDDQKYSDCNSDQVWLELYIGESPEDVQNDDLFYGADN